MTSVANGLADTPASWQPTSNHWPCREGFHVPVDVSWSSPDGSPTVISRCAHWSSSARSARRAAPHAIVNDATAGGPTFPAWSIAFTARLWGPSLSPTAANGLAQPSAAAPSSEQSNATGFSLAVNATLALRPLTIGNCNETVGGVASTPHSRASASPAPPPSNSYRTSNR